MPACVHILARVAYRLVCVLTSRVGQATVCQERVQVMLNRYATDLATIAAATARLVADQLQLLIDQAKERLA